jgi:hypothetical protein
MTPAAFGNSAFHKRRAPKSSDYSHLVHLIDGPLCFLY